MARYCNKCGFALKDDDKFCDNCGQPVNEVPKEQSGVSEERKDVETTEEVIEKPEEVVENTETKEKKKGPFHYIFVYFILIPFVIAVILEGEDLEDFIVLYAIASICEGIRGILKAPYFDKHSSLKKVINGIATVIMVLTLGIAIFFSIAVKMGSGLGALSMMILLSPILIIFLIVKHIMKKNKKSK